MSYIKLLISVVSLFLFSIETAAANKGQEQSGRIKFPGGKTYLVRVTLTDKNGTAYSISHPEMFLSRKSLNRRARQNIRVDSTDLPVSSVYLSRLTDIEGVEIVCQSKWNNTVLVKTHTMSLSKTIESLPFVAKTEKVFTSPDSIERSTRTLYHEELEKWEGNMDEDYGMTSKNIDMIKGRMLHRLGYKGRGMTIAVFDGGFMNTDKIPALKDVKIVGHRDFVAFKSDNIFQEHDHGTKVLSTMAVNVPGVFVGTAPEAEYWLFRVEDTHTESLAEEDYWAAAAEYADSIGVDIISSSLGYQEFDDKSTNHQYPELDGNHALISKTASKLSSKGIIHVNSAGNAGMGTWKKINFPADAHDILAVGAVNSKRINASFSSVGPSDDGRVKPDIMALGSPATVITGRGAISNDMGTSFAAPIVSGMVACLWQSSPKSTASEIMDAIRKGADQHDSPNNIFGYGIADFEKSYIILNDKKN